MPSDLNITIHDFTDRQAQAVALAAQVAAQLQAGLDERGHALLAVSGGNTPKDFFAQLARQPLAWDKVTVTLVDERWVPEKDDRSNARLVQSHLLRDAAAAATFVPLYSVKPTPEEGLEETAARLDALPLPFDAVLLGMGDDGHTASFFPGGDHLAEALDLHGRVRVLSMRAPGAGEPRITLSLPTVLQTRALYLQIQGETKRALLDEVRQGRGEAANYPVRAVLAQPRVPVAVYWCP